MLSTVKGVYICDLCGSRIVGRARFGTFLPSQDVGKALAMRFPKMLPPLTMDFCCKAHAEEYWLGSAHYNTLFNIFTRPPGG